MAIYRVEITYATRRSCVVEGMFVKAFNDDEADDIARAKVLGKSKARQWVSSNVREPDAYEIEHGLANPINP